MIKNVKSISKFILFFLPVILIIVIITKYKFDSDNQKEKDIYSKQYWNQCDVEFCGIVKSKKHIYRGFGYICLDKSYSNKDESDSLYINGEVFVYQIKEDKILFISEVAQLQIGDSICYNINQNKSELRYHNGELVYSHENAVRFKTDIDYSPDKFECK